MLARVRRWDVESCFFKKDKPKNTTKHLVGVARLQKTRQMVQNTRKMKWLCIGQSVSPLGGRLLGRARMVVI